MESPSTEAATGSILQKRVLLKILQEHPCVGAFRPATLLKRDSDTGAFCEICEIFKNIYSEEPLRTTSAAPQPTLDHYGGVNLTHLILNCG